MQDNDSMDAFWLWLEQQEEQQMCEIDWTKQHNGVHRASFEDPELTSKMTALVEQLDRTRM